MIGDEGVIATARALAGYEHEVSEFNPNLAKYLITFVAINSETDALPIGNLLEMWLPSKRPAQEEKIKHAEDFYRERAMIACNKVLELIGSENLP